LTQGTQWHIHLLVAEFRWDLARDARLRRERRIGFEAIIALIEAGHLWRVRQNNPARYPGQVLYDVEVDGYIYSVAAEPEVGGDGTAHHDLPQPPGVQASRAYQKARGR